MKFYSIASFLLVISQLSVNWSQKAWELTGVQFSTSAILSSKLPSANYHVYDQIITDTSHLAVYALNETPLQQKKVPFESRYSLQLSFDNEQKNLNQTVGVAFNWRNLSSYITVNPVQVLTPNSGDYFLAMYDFTHKVPVFLVDYAFHKTVQIGNRLSLKAGVGGYAGMSFGNQLFAYGIARDEFGNSIVTSAHWSMDTLFQYTKHIPTIGIFTSFGIDFALNPKTDPIQNWWLFYQSRFGGDYFGIKNMPVAWFSFQTQQQFGIRYKFD